MKKIFISCTAALFLSGCASQSVSYFTLNQPRGATETVVKEITSIVLVQSIEFPEYLTSRNIAVRTAANELELAEVHNWAEPFDVMVTNYLREQLHVGLKNTQIISSTRYAKPSLKIKMNIICFEKNEQNNQVEFTARWWVLDGKTSSVVKEGLVTESLKPKDESYGSSAATHSLLLSQFSDYLIAELK